MSTYNINKNITDLYKTKQLLKKGKDISTYAYYPPDITAGKKFAIKQYENNLLSVAVILEDGKEIVIKCKRFNNIAFIKKRIKELESLDNIDLIDLEKGLLSDFLMIKYLSNLTLFVSKNL